MLAVAILLVLLTTVDEDDLCKFGRIGLEIILPSPFSDIVELSLSAAVVCGRDDDVYMSSANLTNSFPGVTALSLRSAAPTTYTLVLWLILG